MAPPGWSASRSSAASLPGDLSTDEFQPGSSAIGARMISGTNTPATVDQGVLSTHVEGREVDAEVLVVVSAWVW